MAKKIARAVGTVIKNATWSSTSWAEKRKREATVRKQSDSDLRENITNGNQRQSVGLKTISKVEHFKVSKNFQVSY